MLNKFLSFLLLLNLSTQSVSVQSNSGLREIPDDGYGMHQSVSKEIALIKTDETFDGDEFYTSYGLVRYSEYVINDSGTFSNYYDTVIVNNIYDRFSTSFSNNNNYYSDANTQTFNYQTQWNNYSTLTVNLTMRIREINDGYQHIYIYNGNNSNATMISHGRLEHGGNTKNTNWESYNLYFEIPISMIPNYKFYIRYNASGLFNDDWENELLITQMSLSTENRYSTGIWQIVENSNQSYTCYLLSNNYN